MTKPLMDFGYNPPCGERGYEVITPRNYLYDLHRALDVASQNFSSIWSSDHLNYGSEFRVECWTMLTWMAARYPGPMLGTVVMCNSFRSPALLAKMSASLQEMSTGRLILGYGAGWYEDEYKSYGFDYPSAGVRVDMFEEGVQIIKKMWVDSPANFKGKYYRIDNVYCEPRPDPQPILMLGGGGEKKTLKVVAQYADWWNDVMRPIPDLSQKLAVLQKHCETVGRDYNSIRKTLAPRFFIDKDHKKALRMAEGKNASGQVIAGDPMAVCDQLYEIAEMGFDMVVTTFPKFQELDDMKLFVDEVIPQFC
ncbi:MAG: LLM class flavin-dependent oxidoreductase [SAR202 cluster bacterium]|nr:LLM class flavin-dependent oxidoreductase [SAR202 cluster bacterium]MQG66558.1 LLM class flavin-dependent oxidoreductase [SAR202 cluster bacterium]|tara:strand:- start:3864 stop:4787 length:924 start_codon:yes stop_codon:yes gene_type:complete